MLRLPQWLRSKTTTYQLRKWKGHGFYTWVGRSPGEGSGNPLQYSCLGNSMKRGAWWATDRGGTKDSDTTYRLNSNNKLMLIYSLSHLFSQTISIWYWLFLRYWSVSWELRFCFPKSLQYCGCQNLLKLWL